MVGGLIEEENVGLYENGSGYIAPHSPASGETRNRLVHQSDVEAEAGEDLSGLLLLFVTLDDFQLLLYSYDILGDIHLLILLQLLILQFIIQELLLLQ